MTTIYKPLIEASLTDESKWMSTSSPATSSKVPSQPSINTFVPASTSKFPFKFFSFKLSWARKIPPPAYALSSWTFLPRISILSDCTVPAEIGFYTHKNARKSYLPVISPCVWAVTSPKVRLFMVILPVFDFKFTASPKIEFAIFIEFSSMSPLLEDISTAGASSDETEVLPSSARILIFE